MPTLDPQRPQPMSLTSGMGPSLINHNRAKGLLSITKQAIKMLKGEAVWTWMFETDKKAVMQSNSANKSYMNLLNGVIAVKVNGQW